MESAIRTLVSGPLLGVATGKTPSVGLAAIVGGDAGVGELESASSRGER